MLKWLQFQQHKPPILVLNSLSMMNTAHHHHHHHHLHHSRLLLSSQPEPPSSNGSRAHNGLTSNEADFDTNMVIILAALLCALICALGLNSIVRCALRCTRRFTFESSGETAAAGLKKSTLRKLPVTVYGAGADMPATECPICLGEFCDGDKVRVLPRCHHGFHVRCIDVWLASHSSCPTCRQSLLEPCTDTVAGSGHDADAPISGEEVV